MAFVSQLKNRASRGRGNRSPFISFRMTVSGSTGAHVGKLTGLQGKDIDIEIDEDSKVLRIAQVDGGFKVGSNGAFSMSKKVFRTISPSQNLPRIIELKLSEDGWWYGSYGEKA